MKLRSPSILIAICSGAGVIGAALVDLGRTSPGPLTTVHEREPDLAGRRDCSECHGGWNETMTQACLACHEEIGGQLQREQGLHGGLAAGQAVRCALCHSEHHGADFAMVNQRSFLLAGVPDLQEFDHGTVGFDMRGPHLELVCSECHEHAEDAPLAEGARRYLGLRPNCVECHENPHEGAMARACTQCHVQEGFDQLAFVDHEQLLPLVGGHGGLGCRECHAEETSHSLEAWGRRRDKPTPRECVECHESPHQGSFVDGVAAAVAATPGASCVTCHVAEHTSFREEGLEVDAAFHAESGFSLDVPHDQAACEACHASELEPFEMRYPGRGPDECSRCHEDPHGGQFAEGPFAGRECFACHDRQRFEPEAFDAEEHALAALPLEGAHLETDCHACHELPADEGPRIFHGTPARCDACHEDAHCGYFAERAAELPPTEQGTPEHGECARCHHPTTFAELPADGFDHEVWTGFALRGAHAQAACESCHPRSAENDPFGRTFGHVEEHFGSLAGCATCHADPHAGAFDDPELPDEVGGRIGCERCHEHTSFRAFPDGFDHALWTGYPLEGAHAETGCSACHAPVRGPGGAAPSHGAAPGRRCADCHEEPHAGQFQVDGVTECERCHESTERFASFVFNHSLDSRFYLGEAHEQVACSACHNPVLEDGLEFVRYRPLQRDCADCHGDQRGPRFRRRKGGR